MVFVEQNDDSVLAEELGASLARAENRDFYRLSGEEQHSYLQQALEVLREERLSDLERILQSF